MLIQEISEKLQAGNAAAVKELVARALNEGIDAQVILRDGLMAGMDVIGKKFKENLIFVPQVLMSARAMNQGAELLKESLGNESVGCAGRVCLGTVFGDLHDIGKNLVKMMLEAKGCEVIDLGVNVPADAFIKTVIEKDCQIICASALLSTTMPVMKDIVEAAKAAGIRDKVKIMVGGAPVTEEFCKSIGADAYSLDATSCAEAALAFVK